MLPQSGMHFQVKPFSALFNPVGEAANSRNTNFLNQLNHSALVRLTLAVLKRSFIQSHEDCIFHSNFQMSFLGVLTDGYSMEWPLGNSWQHNYILHSSTIPQLEAYTPLKMVRSQTVLSPSEKGQTLEARTLIFVFVCRAKDHQPTYTQMP